MPSSVEMPRGLAFHRPDPLIDETAHTAIADDDRFDVCTLLASLGGSRCPGLVPGSAASLGGSAPALGAVRVGLEGETQARHPCLGPVDPRPTPDARRPTPDARRPTISLQSAEHRSEVFAVPSTLLVHDAARSDEGRQHAEVDQVTGPSLVERDWVRGRRGDQRCWWPTHVGPAQVASSDQVPDAPHKLSAGCPTCS